MLQWGRDQLIAEMLPKRLWMCRCYRLQWGRDQLIAEIQFPFGRQNEVGHASMGPRSIDRGNTRVPNSIGLFGLASMGPRSIDRGNVAIENLGELGQIASMGPRSIDRGNISGFVRRPEPRGSLQWGRDQLIAEITQLTEQEAKDTELQWGRDQLIAEMKHWNLGKLWRMSLQWGRDQLIAEIT